MLSFGGKEALGMQLREASVKKNPTDNKKVTLTSIELTVSYTYQCGALLPIELVKDVKMIKTGAKQREHFDVHMPL